MAAAIAEARAISPSGSSGCVLGSGASASASHAAKRADGPAIWPRSRAARRAAQSGPDGDQGAEPIATREEPRAPAGRWPGGRGVGRGPLTTPTDVGSRGSAARRRLRSRGTRPVRRRRRPSARRSRRSRSGCRGRRLPRGRRRRPGGRRSGRSGSRALLRRRAGRRGARSARPRRRSGGGCLCPCLKYITSDAPDATPHVPRLSHRSRTCVASPSHRCLTSVPSPGRNRAVGVPYTQAPLATPGESAPCLIPLRNKTLRPLLDGRLRPVL